MIILYRKTMVNLDSGLVVEWATDERGQNTATLFAPGRLTPDGGRAGYTLDAAMSGALWRAICYPSTRDRLGVVALGDGE
jgi:hypothetical protein